VISQNAAPTDSFRAEPAFLIHPERCRWAFFYSSREHCRLAVLGQLRLTTGNPVTNPDNPWLVMAAIYRGSHPRRRHGRGFPRHRYSYAPEGSYHPQVDPRIELMYIIVHSKSLGNAFLVLGPAKQLHFAIVPGSQRIRNLTVSRRSVTMMSCQ
jgi:hypothetical protein